MPVYQPNNLEYRKDHLHFDVNLYEKAESKLTHGIIDSDSLWEVEVRKVHINERFKIYSGDECIIDTTINRQLEAMNINKDNWASCGTRVEAWEPKTNHEKESYKVYLSKEIDVYKNHNPIFAKRFDNQYHESEFESYPDYHEFFMLKYREYKESQKKSPAEARD